MEHFEGHGNHWKVFGDVEEVMQHLPVAASGVMWLTGDKKLVKM